MAWIAYANYDPNDGRFGDDLFYDFMARGLAAGKGYLSAFNAQSALWPPGYSLILAGLYKAIGHSIIAAKVLNAVAAAVTVVLVYFLGARVFSKKVGGIAAVMLAVFPGQIYYSTLILNESLFAFFSTLILLFAVIWISKGRGIWPPALLLLGVLFGWAALMRSEALVLLVAALLVWALAAPSWRAFAGQGALVLARRGDCDNALDGAKRNRHARLHPDLQRRRPHLPRRPPRRPVRHPVCLPRRRHLE